MSGSGTCLYNGESLAYVADAPPLTAGADSAMMAPPGVEPWRLTTSTYGEEDAAMAEHTTARTYQFRVQLTRDGHRRLDERLAAHARLYNGALQERRDAWRIARKSLTFASQCRELTGVRQDDPEWAGEHRRLAVGTLKRVDHAFQAFFRRVKAGETPGFPRFKPRSRFRTIELYSGADRFLQVSPDGARATIRIKGLPAMRLRLHRPLPDGQPLIIHITRTPRRVVASLVYAHADPQPAEAAPTQPVGIDAGVAHRFTLSDGRHVERRDLDRRKLRRLQRRVARAKRGSSGRRKKVAALAKEWQRVTERNRGDEHQLANAIVQAYDFIAVEDLRIGNMTRSASGTPEERGREVRSEPHHPGPELGKALRQDRLQGRKRRYSIRQGISCTHVSDLLPVRSHRCEIPPVPGGFLLHQLRPRRQR